MRRPNILILLAGLASGIAPIAATAADDATQFDGLTQKVEAGEFKEITSVLSAKDGKLVYEHYFNSTYRLSLSGYSYQIDGLITQAETADAEPYYDNLDDVHARGVERELEGSYQYGAVLRGSWTLQRAKGIATNQELTSSPQQLGKFSASMPVLASKLFANLELQYNSASVTLARTRSPSSLARPWMISGRRPTQKSPRSGAGLGSASGWTASVFWPASVGPIDRRAVPDASRFLKTGA